MYDSKQLKEKIQKAFPDIPNGHFFIKFPDRLIILFHFDLYAMLKKPVKNSRIKSVQKFPSAYWQGRTAIEVALRTD